MDEEEEEGSKDGGYALAACGKGEHLFYILSGNIYVFDCLKRI